MEGLTEGRMVHFVARDGMHRSAVITHVWNKETGMINLFVFPDGSHSIESTTPTSISFDATGAVNTWHWIEKA
jgi:hypothetical protein